MVSEGAEPSEATLNLLLKLREFASIASILVSAQQRPSTDWEVAGQELWDLSIAAEAAALLADQATLLAATAEAALARLPSPGSSEAPSSEAVHAARALEIALGILANVATHRQLHGQLLAQPVLAPLAARALWADDAASVFEACRLAAALLLSSSVRN